MKLMLETCTGRGVERGRDEGIAAGEQKLGAPGSIMPVDQDVQVAGQTGNSGYQYTLLGEDSGELYEWAPKIAAALKSLPLLTDVNFDQQQGGLEANLIIDRATARRASGSPLARSTTRFTTPLGSARYR